MKISNTKNTNTQSHLLRKIIVFFLVITIILCCCFAVLYAIHDVKILKLFLHLLIIQHVLWLVGFLYYKELSIKTLIMMYLSYILVALYPIACIYWNSGNPVVFSWYLLVMFGAIVFQMRSIGVWISVILILVISVFFFSHLFPNENLTSLLIYRANILTVVSSITFFAFFTTVYAKKIQYDDYESMHVKVSQSAIAESHENLERDEALYNNIINYIEKNQPFKNPDFNTHSLATALNSNVTYISKAISVCNGGNFNVMLNHFRINYVKSLIDSGALKKYTIDYIYAKAGYKHRSTFNAAFKNIIGMTPSEYASVQNANDN